MDGKVAFNVQICGHCDQYLKVSGFGIPCSWDSLSEQQRDFLRKSGMDAARWCSHRETERLSAPDGGGKAELPKAIPIQSDLI